MTFSLTTTTIAIAIQLGLAITLKSPLCHGFMAPMTSTVGAGGSALHAHARRSHTYSNAGAADAASSSSKTIFTLMDKDGNGKIDSEELRQYLQETGPYTDAVAKSIFERLDLNHDGHLALDELEQGMKQHNLFAGRQQKQQEYPVINPQKTFAIKPKRKSSSVATNKNKRSKQQKIQKYKDQARKFFDALDVNQDGFISIAELKEHFLVQRMQDVAQSNVRLLSSLNNKSQPRKNKKKSVMHNEEDKETRRVVPWHYSEAAIQNLFQTIDVNGTGRISLQDLLEAFVRHPSVRHAFLV